MIDFTDNINLENFNCRLNYGTVNLIPIKESMYFASNE